MTEEELQALLEKTTPERDRYELFVEDCQDQDVRLRFSPAKGENWSSAALLTIAETALRAAAGAEMRLSHLNVTVLRPAQQADTIALSRVLRRDRDVVHAEAWLFSHAVIEPMLHATATLRAADFEGRS
jgi:acyl-coenzyme A thioesterase PaaI-like protein